MALTPFQSRVRATVVPVRAPQQSTGIGDALTVLGRTAGQIADNNAQTEERVAAVDHQIAMRERERGDDDLALSVAVEQAKAAQRLRIFDEENQNAADYEKRKIEAVDKEVSAINGMIGANDRVAKRFAVPLTTFASTEKADAQVYAKRVYTKAVGAQFEAAVDTTSNLAYSDPVKAEPVIAALIEAHRGRTDIPAALKLGMERVILAPIRASQLNGRVDRGDYDAVEKEINSGQWASALSNDDQKRLINKIGTERNAARIESERAQSRAREDARDSLQAMETTSAAGAVPAGKDIARLRSNITEAGGDASDLARVAVLEAESSVARYYPQGTASQKMSRDADALRAKLVTGRASDHEKMALNYLDKRIDKATSEEAKQGKSYLANGVPGRMQALSELSATDPKARFEVAEKIEKGLGYLAMVTEPVQAGALRGMEDLKANAKLIDDKKASAAFTAATRTAQLGLSEEALQGHMQVANALYVDWTKQAGASEAEFNPTLYQRAVRMAFGGVQQDGKWVGGLGLYRGRSVVLPDNYSDDQFDRTIARLTFADAVYSDGSKATKADVIANYAPVYVGDNSAGKPVYVFRNRARQELKMKDGRAFPVAMP